MLSEDEIRRKLTEKFGSFESEPQEESWEKIRARINLNRMFQDYEAEPQDESWEKIRAGIDLQRRMNEFEAEPQEESWEKIRAGVELAEKFKNYEPEPQAISWLKIQEAIQPQKRRRGIIPLFFRIGLAAGVVLMLGSLWWLLNRNDTPAAVANNSSVKKSVFDAAAVSARPENKAEKHPGKHLTVNASKMPLAVSKEPAQGGRTGKNKTMLNNKAMIAGNKTNTSKTLPAPALIDTKQPQATLANAQTSAQAEFKAELLQAKGYRQKSVRKPFNAIAYNTEKPYQEKAQRVHRDIVFNASLMPLQTYQAFTVMPQTNTYIQQVGRLDAIDNQRLGIQLRAGAMKPLSNRYAVGLSATYTGLQQWANYELNNGEYEVQTSNNGTYTLVGIGEQVSQKQFMQTVGLKVDNAYLVSRKKNAVYAIAGAEAVHVLTNKDFGYYINASVGVSYPIKGGKSLWIEPTFRYSLSQSADANNYLKIRPYNIGLNLRVNFI
ncbi:hypothetical protein [Emticicia sp. 21SJ11W-3]|uniref:hypothetical protein n=1 Tax=Emticicia sp. 21SJ11W-3 TaxID=2916755 RepID=UPI0020A0BB3D|nr:hypothetical protein [Emticicia sp. 21SJ11W-3]UTA69279.1 hypothetical protein MB380_05610 [Emticicia sp. 21SJ11W-3]